MLRFKIGTEKRFNDKACRKAFASVHANAKKTKNHAADAMERSDINPVGYAKTKAPMRGLLFWCLWES